LDCILSISSDSIAMAFQSTSSSSGVSLRSNRFWRATTKSYHRRPRRRQPHLSQAPISRINPLVSETAFGETRKRTRHLRLVQIGMSRDVSDRGRSVVRQHCHDPILGDVETVFARDVTLHLLPKRPADHVKSVTEPLIERQPRRLLRSCHSHFSRSFIDIINVDIATIMWERQVENRRAAFRCQAAECADPLGLQPRSAKSSNTMERA
jgi:hypothetical protein